MIKDVVALVDGSAGDSVPLEHAERIVRVFDANLTALYLNVLPDVLIAGQSTLSPIAIDEVMATSKRAGAAAATRLSARLEGAGVPTELRHVDVADSELWDLVSSASRAADLLVARHPSPGGVRPQWRSVAEAALFGSARGIYFAECPPGPRPMFQSVVVAWDSSHSATRALTEAMPFLQKAQRTLIVTVDEAGTPDGGEMRLQDKDLARHLARLGVTTTHRRVTALGRSVSEVLVEEIAGANADLFVMGAYGHSRVREWIFGGVTCDFLTHSPVPVLMAR
jgi:nucleotide-binding universal stress UspA family protein